MSTLIERLRIKAGVMEMGERIAWGNDTALMREAAGKIEALEAQLESVGAGGVGAMIPKTIPDRTALIDLIAEHLSGTYHCTRVWSAWRVGTMSQDDFADVGESDTPSEITEAIIATLISQQIAEPAAATGWKWVPLEPTAEMLQAGQDTPVSESDEDAPEDYKAVYRAMLAAAPHPQQVAGLEKDAEITALKAERDDLRKDAERYRRIRNGPHSDNYGDLYAMTFQGDGDIPVKGEALDRAVDAAIRKTML